jgi:hypothetical protein
MDWFKQWRRASSLLAQLPGYILAIDSHHSALDALQTVQLKTGNPEFSRYCLYSHQSPLMLLLEPVLVQSLNYLIGINCLAEAAIVTCQCASQVVRLHVDVITQYRTAHA